MQSLTKIHRLSPPSFIGNSSRYNALFNALPSLPRRHHSIASILHKCQQINHRHEHVYRPFVNNLKRYKHTSPRQPTKSPQSSPPSPSLFLAQPEKLKHIAYRLPPFLLLVLFLPITFESPQGPSMLPTMAPVGEIFILLKYILCHDRIRDGDIVVATRPPDHTARVGKRVISSKVVKDEETGSEKKYYWIEGDNPEYSRDSRHYGWVEERDVIGVLVCRVWPSFKWMERKKIEEERGNLESRNIYVVQRGDEGDSREEN